MRLLKQLFRRVFGTRTLFVDLADNHARLRARGFDLVDEDDRVVGMLQLAQGGGSQLMLTGPNQKSGVLITCGAEGTDFTLLDARGKPAITVSAGTHGPRVSFTDPETGKPRAMLDLDPQSRTCSLGLIDRFGHTAFLKQS